MRPRSVVAETAGTRRAGAPLRDASRHGAERSRRGARRLAAAACLVASLLAARAGRADPLETSDYQLDLFQGPLLSPIRVTALGGAYAGYGDGTAGLVANAASPASREISTIRHVELDLRGSVSIPLDIFENNDFDNSGDLDDDYSDFVYVTVGSILHVGAAGFGLTADVQSFELSDPRGGTLAVTAGRYHLLAAYGLLHDQIDVGGGARAVTLGLHHDADDLVYAGAAPELGVLVKPAPIPFRFGATYRLAVSASEVGGTSFVPSGVRLPRAVSQPWELETGISFQLGPRPLNIPFVDAEDEDDAAEERVAAARSARARERERAQQTTADPAERAALAAADAEREADLRALEDQWLERESAWLLGRHDDRVADLPRERLLVMLSLLASGPTAKGVGIEDFLGQSVPGQSPRGVIGSAGASVNFSPRFGVEAEAVPNLLVLRTGSYYEPSRFGSVGRQHFTFGGQLRVLSTSLWRILPEWPWGMEVGMDIAPRYQSLSASVAIFR